MTPNQIRRMGYEVKGCFYKRKDVYVWNCPKGWAMGRMINRKVPKVRYYVALKDALQGGKDESNLQDSR